MAKPSVGPVLGGLGRPRACYGGSLRLRDPLFVPRTRLLLASFLYLASVVDVGADSPPPYCRNRVLAVAVVVLVCCGVVMLVLMSPCVNEASPSRFRSRRSRPSC